MNFARKKKIPTEFKRKKKRREITCFKEIPFAKDITIGRGFLIAERIILEKNRAFL